MEPSYPTAHSALNPQMERTEKFYKTVIAKVLENTKKHFAENGVSDRVHEKLRQVWVAKTDQAEVYERNRKHIDSLKMKAK